MPAALPFHAFARAAAAAWGAIACATILLLGCTTGALAQPSPQTTPLPEADTPWGLGLAAGSVQKPYNGMARKAIALPLLSYENQYIKLSSPNLEVKLPGLTFSDSSRLRFSLEARFFSEGGYQASDSAALAGMAERKSSAWIGPAVRWETSIADVKLELLGDASGHSKGRRVALGLQRRWVLGNHLMLVPQVGVEWVDEKYVTYYYGVLASEATPERAAYAGQSTMNVGASLSAVYRFDRQQSLVLNAGVKSLGKEIKNSPIVGRSTENRLTVGYLYRF